ncbi:MAG: FGGY family carbohydrate kinase, partial [Chloroflexota bacterium]
MATKNVLAIDLGNESGRVVNVAFDGEKLTARTRYRFMNHAITVGGVLHRDVLNFFQHIQDGIIHATQDTPVDGVGVASFGVDFGLLDARGRLLANPVHMRDSRTDGIAAQVHAQVSEQELFRRTGVASHPINTLFQLAALVRDDDWQLQHAHTLLTMPNLVNYWLTGETLSEFTHSTTTQCYSPGSGTWDAALLEQLDIPAHIFPQIVPPGECIGSYRDVPVYSVASHDTASAVVAVPAESERFAYCSSGTWSLFGLEVDAPITS